MIDITLDLEEDFFIDVLETALYDGIWYWVKEAKYSLEPDDEKSRAEQIILDGCVMTLTVDTGNDYEEFNLTKNKLIRGYKRYCKWRTSRRLPIYNDSCYIDSEEADIIIQLGLFNYIIFG